MTTLGGFPLGLMTCYDLRFPELPRALAKRGAEVIVVPAAWVAGPRKVEHWRTLLRARAIENTGVGDRRGTARPALHRALAGGRPDGRRGGGGRRGRRDADARPRPRTVARGAPHQPVAGQPPSLRRGYPPARVRPPPPRRRAERAPRRSRLASRSPVRGSVRGCSCCSSVVGCSGSRPTPGAAGVGGEAGAGRWSRSCSRPALAARTGGRPFVCGVLALALGAAVVVTDEPMLRTGAAVLTCVVTAVLAVMATVPAVKLAAAVREVVVAMRWPLVGASASVGLEPAVSLVAGSRTRRSGVARAGFLVVVYRLGGGLHGLGRRGLVVVLVGGVVLALTLAYAEAAAPLRHPRAGRDVLDGRQWALETSRCPAADPGVARRARPGVGRPHAGPAPAGLVGLRLRGDRGRAGRHAFLDPSLIRGGLTTLYSVIVGCSSARVIIRLDLLVTGSGPGRPPDRGLGGAVRPEPGRTQPLL